MRLWHVFRVDGSICHGEHAEALIRAESEQDARVIAGRELEPARCWGIAGAVECVPIDPDGEPGIVLSSFIER